MINKQAPEKKIYSSEGILEIHSIFFTIQGEGPFSGQRSVFVRLAGCNLQCPGCDTEYTSKRVDMHPDLILLNIRMAYEKRIKAGPSPLVVISGGEPFRQNIAPLVRLLVEKGFKVQIETNGTLPPNGEFPYNDLHKSVFIVVSPKTGNVHRHLHDISFAYKYVVDTRNNNIAADGLPKKVLDHTNDGMVARPVTPRQIYIQPVDTGDTEENLGIIEDVTSLALEHGFLLQLQIHKILGVE